METPPPKRLKTCDEEGLAHEEAATALILFASTPSPAKSPEKEYEKEYESRPCNSNRFFGPGYCTNAVEVEIKRNNTTGAKNYAHSQDAWCDHCKWGREHLFPADHCFVLTDLAENNSAITQANKYNGKGDPDTFSSSFYAYHGLAGKKPEHDRTFGKDARAVVVNSRAKVNKKYGMCVLFDPATQVPADCPLNPVPKELCDSEDPSKVRFSFAHGQLCFYKLHPNDCGKGVSKGMRDSAFKA